MGYFGSLQHTTQCRICYLLHVLVTYPNGTILLYLCLDEETLQDTWIRTNKNNMYLGQAVYYALALIVQLANFHINTLKVKE